MGIHTLTFLFHHITFASNGVNHLHPEVVVEFFSKIVYIHVIGVIFRVVVFSPHGVNNFLSGNYIASVFIQEREQSKFPWGKFNDFAVYSNSFRKRVKLQINRSPFGDSSYNSGFFYVKIIAYKLCVFSLRCILGADFCSTFLFSACFFGSFMV